MKKPSHVFFSLLLICLLLTSGCNKVDTSVPQDTAPQVSPSVNEETPLADTPVVPEETNLPEMAKTPEAAYVSVLDVLSAKVPSSSFSKYCVAELTDLDGDNVHELIATYLSIDEREQRVEIWTVRDDAPALLWEQSLFVNAGGPVGGVCRVAIDGKDYLCIYEANINGTVGENENRMERHTGTFWIFSLQKRMAETTSVPGALFQEHWLRYDFSGPDARTPSDMHAAPKFLFDGKPCDSSVFNGWVAAFDAATETYLAVGRNLYIGKPFEDVLAEIQE